MVTEDGKGFLKKSVVVFISPIGIIPQHEGGVTLWLRIYLSRESTRKFNPLEFLILDKSADVRHGARFTQLPSREWIESAGSYHAEAASLCHGDKAGSVTDGNSLYRIRADFSIISINANASSVAAVPAAQYLPAGHTLFNDSSYDLVPLKQ